MQSIKFIFSLLGGFLILHVISCLPNDSKYTGNGPFPLRQLKDINSLTTTSCGGILNDTSGEINYKLNQPIASNERCIWIIQPINTTDFTIGIFNLGFPTPNLNHQITISGFALGRNQTQVLPSETGLYHMNNCSVIVIAFHSGNGIPLNVTGFSLQYYGFHNGDMMPPSVLSKSVVPDSRSVGYTKHPISGSYSNNELSIYLIPQRIPNEEVNLVIMINGLEQNCVDNVDVYFFNVESPNLWDNTTRVCQFPTYSPTIVSNNDAILLVFQSDESTVGTGFHFTYARFSRGADDGGEGTTTEDYGTTYEDSSPYYY